MEPTQLCYDAAPDQAGREADMSMGRNMSRNMSRKLVAEAIGTFALVFAGTGAVIANDLTGGAISHVGVALSFGLVIMVMVYAVGDVSGAHFNPAVTLAFWLAKRLPGREVAPYIAVQCGAALIASALLRVLFAEHATLGATAPAGSLAQSFTLEVVLTFFLMFVILAVSTGRDTANTANTTNKASIAGLAIGATVCLGAPFGGPISGASMNPARSLGPAVISGQLAVLWLYFAAPIAGSSLAVQACKAVREPGCCS